MFKTYRNALFQLRFDNGYTVSCGISNTHYCSRRSLDSKRIFEEKEMDFVKSEDCELAVFVDDQKVGYHGFVTGEIFDAMGIEHSNDGMVAGWMSADEVARVIAFVQSLPAVPAAAENAKVVDVEDDDEW